MGSLLLLNCYDTDVALLTLLIVIGILYHFFQQEAMVRTKRLARIWEIILFLHILSCRQRDIGVFTVDYLLKIKKKFDRIVMT